ncbi:MAG: hypothetical protein IT223_03170 [Crocinitomicaceae bacterium]|nr:hypothetical protein [Crocinitomicaceae bacterium]
MNNSIIRIPASLRHLLLTGLLIFICNGYNLFAQGVSVNTNGNAPDPSAIFDANAADKGLLIPRLTESQRNAIQSPAQSLLIYNTTSKCFEYWENNQWQLMNCAVCPVPAQPGSITGNNSPCLGSSQSYSVPNVAGVTYSWIFPSGWSQNGGGSIHSVSATVGAGSGNITVTPSNSCGSGTSQSLVVSSLSEPSAPTAAAHTPSPTQIIWNWNISSGATGYKYNSTPDYYSATDTGMNTSYVQTGLSCGNSYTLYVWAYNSCGNSTMQTLTQSSSSCCTEGSGGSITHANGKTIHRFTSSDTFTSNCPMNVEVLVVGGGGGGAYGGGGGGGGFIYQSSFAVNAQSYPVTVGNGGTGGNGTTGSNGGNSLFSTLTAVGGGGGGWSNVNGLSGGSGGGAGFSGAAQNGGAGTPGQGNAGGNTTYYSVPYPTGGGGGAGGAGQSSQSATVAGNGGPGSSSSISGSLEYYAGGGGGVCGYAGGTSGSGGIGGGGNAACPGCTYGSAGIVNTGGGGGGGGWNTNVVGVGGNGGSGVVIISYPTP